MPGVPQVGGSNRGFPKDTAAAALGSPRAVTVPVVTLIERGLHPATGITSGRSGDNP